MQNVIMEDVELARKRKRDSLNENENLNNVRPRKIQKQSPSVVYGLCMHGAEPILRHRHPMTAHAYYYNMNFQLPSHVRVLVITKPETALSAYSISPMIEIMKSWDYSKLRMLFQKGETGEQSRNSLGGMLSACAENIQVNLYDSTCPELLLITSQWTDQAIKRQANPVTNFEIPSYMIVPKQMNATDSNVTTMLFKRTNTDKTQAMPTRQNSEYQNLCKIKTTDTKYKGCCSKALSYVHADLHPVDIICRNLGQQIVHGEIDTSRIPDVSQLLKLRPENMESETWLSQYLARYDLKTNEGRDGFWNTIKSITLLGDWGWKQRYGDRELIDKYDNKQFLLSKFIQKECSRAQHPCYVIVWACRTPTILDMTPVVMGQLFHMRHPSARPKQHGFFGDHSFEKRSHK